MTRHRPGFTLVELLVVITIIVVLLALLTPALDKAIYQTELALCGANLHGVATGVLSYTVEYKRRYPHRPSSRKENNSAEPARVAGGNINFDDRPIIKEHLSLKLFLDPLCGEIDLSPEASQQADNTFSNYDLWYSFYYNTQEPSSPMAKLGNRWSYGENRFNVLASDNDRRDDSGPWNAASHPDNDGLLTKRVLYNRSAEFGGAPILRAMRSQWQGVNGRGTLDNNAVFDDGSVNRYPGVRGRFTDPDRDDLRMVRVPAWNTGSSAAGAIGDAWLRIPPLGR